MQTDAIWPWAEANQGLLSFFQGWIALVALGLGLFAIVREVGAARRAGEARLREYIDFVLALLDALAGDGARALARYDEVEGSAFVMPTLHRLGQRQLTASALQAMSAGPPPHPILAVRIADLLRSQSSGGQFSDRGSAVAYLRQQLDELAQHRAAIAARRP